MVDQHQAAGQDVLVFPRLDAGTSASEAARLDVPSGLLTPAQRSWRRRPVVVDRRARVEVRGRKGGVDLVVERSNGWRAASIPLFEVTAGGAVSMPPELLRRLAAEIGRLGPRDAADVVTLLLAQARYLQYDGGPATASPLSRKIADAFERFARLGL